MMVNNWNLYYFKIFKTILDELVKKVHQLKANDPTNFRTHNDTKLLAAIYQVILKDVPSDPNHRRYFLGNTLGQKHKDWRRVKHSIPNRYRLFFRFQSTSKVIIYVWLNDFNTLRKSGASTDVYTVYSQMLSSGKIPEKYTDLEDESTEIEEKEILEI